METKNSAGIYRDKLAAALKSRTFDITADTDFFIFGAGNTSLLCEHCFVYENIKPVCFIDNDKEKQGKMFHGAKVVSLGEAAAYTATKPIILISSSVKATCDSIKDQLSQSELKDWDAYTIDEYIFGRNADKVLSVFDMLEDDFSKTVYAHIILVRLGAEEFDISFSSPDSYFAIPEFCRSNSSECFVNCGAYVGDTVEEYIWKRFGQFKQVYAFEPGKRNYKALCARIRRLTEEWALDENALVPINAGVGEKNSTMSVESGGVSGASPTTSLHIAENGENMISVYSIDSYFKDITVDLINADVEGCETSVLEGAEQVIKRDKPLLAFCIYHSPYDMFGVPLLIKEFVPSYRLSIRHRSQGLTETTIYAY